MTKQKSTKRALLLSALSLLMCVSMLIGSTFAWFTDSVTSGNNKIVAGNLDIELEYYNGSAWKTVNGATDLFSEERWEPGHTEVVYLKLSNLGSLALKYQLGINIVSETAGRNVDGKTFKLSDYIYMGVVEGVNGQTGAYTKDDAGRAEAIADVTGAGIISTGYTKSGNMTADADDLYLAVVVYMPTTVGNEANYKTGTAAPEINLGVNLMATQYTHEKDSFNDQYDAMATVDDIDELKAALAEEGNVKITLGSNIAFTEAEMTNEIGDNKLNYALMVASGKTVTIDLNGYTLSANYTVDATNTTWDQATLLYVANGGTLIVEDSVGSGKMTFNTNIPCDDYSKSFGVVVYNAGNLVVNGGSLESLVPCPTVGPNGETEYTEYGIVSPAVDNKSTGVLTLNDGTIYSVGHNAVRNFGKIVMNGGLMKSDMFVAVDVESSSMVEIHGGELDGGKTTSMIVRGTAIVDGGFFNEKINPKAGSNLTVTGGTFADFSVLNQLAEGADVTIKLMNDVAFTEAEMTNEIGDNKLNYALMVASGKTVTIDLNGYTLSANYTVDATNTTWDQATLLYVANGGTLIVEDSVGSGKMTFNTNIPCDDYSKSFGVVVYNAGNLVVNGGSLESLVPCPTVGPNGETQYTEYGIVSPAVDNRSTGVLTLNNGTIYSVGHYAVRNGGKFVMNGGLLKADMFVAIDGATTSTEEIHGGELDGGKTTSMIVRGTAIVDGGFFNEKINPKTGSNLTVTGGTFAVDPSSYVTTGYVATEDNGVWTVTAQ